MAAHLGSGLDVPDLQEVVKRPAEDAIPVPRESDREHDVRVTRKRAYLPPTHIYLMRGPGEWRGFLPRIWNQEGLSELCPGRQKFCLAF